MRVDGVMLGYTGFVSDADDSEFSSMRDIDDAAD
jgi:hypothetical protein